MLTLSSGGDGAASAQVRRSRRRRHQCSPQPQRRSAAGARRSRHRSCKTRRFGALRASLGVDLQQLRGSGPNGRITREDVQSFVKGALAERRRQPVPRCPFGAAAVAEDWTSRSTGRSNACRFRASRSSRVRICTATGCRFRTSPTTTKPTSPIEAFRNESQRRTGEVRAAPNSRCWPF